MALWAQERGIPTEIVHATNTAQTPAFLEFHRIVKEHRLHFSDKLEGLEKEMSTFIYELVNGSRHTRIPMCFVTALPPMGDSATCEMVTQCSLAPDHAQAMQKCKACICNTAK